MATSQLLTKRDEDQSEAQSKGKSMMDFIVNHKSLRMADGFRIRLPWGLNVGQAS
jgi:hypothetical protein